jgi:hypothetical protein
MKNISLLDKIRCFIVGWKPEWLQECGMSSFSKLKRYTAAILVLSIIWGTIGWCVAVNYIGIASWYGKAITVAFFIGLVILIEWSIIHAHGKKLTFTKIARIGLAVCMAVLGSLIFDQIIFKNDVDVKMKEVRDIQINAAIPKRTLLIDAEILEISNTIDAITNVNQALYDEIARRPTIRQISTNTTTRQVGTDEEGKPKYETDKTVNQSFVPNPKIEQVQQNEKILQVYHTRIDSLQNKKLNIANEVREEYKKARTGLIEEIRALVSLIGSDWVIRGVYIIIFSFLTFLELLVLLAKGDACEYEVLAEHQDEIKKQGRDAQRNTYIQSITK